MNNASNSIISAEIADALRSLPYPAKPVEGRGNIRTSFPLLNNKLASSLWPLIPSYHKYESKFGRVARYISPEASQVCSPVLAEIDAQERAKWEKTVASWDLPKTPSKSHLPSVQRDREAAIVVNIANISKSELTVEEQAEMVELLTGAHHPIMGRALDLKNKSGLTWGQIHA